MTQKFTVAGGCGDPDCESCGGAGARTAAADEIDGGPPDPDAFEVKSAVDVSDGEPYAVEAGIGAEDIPPLPTLVGQSSPEEENETRAKIAQWHEDVRALGLDPSAAFEMLSGGKSGEDSGVELRTLPTADDVYSAERVDADGEGGEGGDDEYRPGGVMAAQSGGRADGSDVPAWSDTLPDADAEGDDEPPEGVIGASRDAARGARDRAALAAKRLRSIPEGWSPQGVFTEEAEREEHWADQIGGPDESERDSEEVNDAILRPDTAGDPWADALGEGNPEGDADGADGGSALVNFKDIVRNAGGDYRGKGGPDPRPAESGPSRGGQGAVRRSTSQSATPSYQNGVNYAGGGSAQSGDSSGEGDKEEYRPRGILTADPDEDGGDADE